MIIEHSGDFKVVDPKTKEVRYDSTNVTLNLRGPISGTWNFTGDNTMTGVPIGKVTTDNIPTTKDQILYLLKGETFYDIKNILEEVFEEVQEKAKY